MRLKIHAPIAKPALVSGFSGAFRQGCWRNASRTPLELSFEGPAVVELGERPSGEGGTIPAPLVPNSL